MLAQRAVMLQGRCFPNDGRASAAAGGLGAGNGRPWSGLHLHRSSTSTSTSTSMRMHAAFSTCKHHFFTVATSYLLLLCARTAWPSCQPHRPTYLWPSHAKLSVRLRSLPRHGIPNYSVKLSYARENQTWVYVQSASIHPCPSSLSALLLLAICVCRNPRLLLGVACHLLALLHQAA